MYYLSDLISRAVVLDINPDFMTYFGVGNIIFRLYG